MFHIVFFLFNNFCLSALSDFFFLSSNYHIFSMLCHTLEHIPHTHTLPLFLMPHLGKNIWIKIREKHLKQILFCVKILHLLLISEFSQSIISGFCKLIEIEKFHKTILCSVILLKILMPIVQFQFLMYNTHLIFYLCSIHLKYEILKFLSNFV